MKDILTNLLTSIVKGQRKLQNENIMKLIIREKELLLQISILKSLKKEAKAKKGKGRVLFHLTWNFKTVICSV